MLDFPTCYKCNKKLPYPDKPHACAPKPAPSPGVGSVVPKEKRLIKSENDVPVFLGEMVEGICEHEVPNRIQRALLSYLMADAITHKSIHRFAGRQHLAEQLGRILGEPVHEQQIKYALNALEADGIWFKTLRGPALRTLLRKDRHLARAHRRAGCPRVLVLFTTPMVSACQDCNGYVAQGIDEIERVANGGV